jgi:opacity protein-like surface antigen
MKKFLTIASLLLASTLPANAQEWSLGVHSGAFVFGEFVERRMRVGTPEGPISTSSIILTAETRPGVTVDLERSFAPRWAFRVEGTFTRAPLAAETRSDGDPVGIDAGQLDVTTLALPLIFRINPNGAFRFHLHGGPAVALYKADAVENVDGAEPVFEGRQTEWGLMFGGGVTWWLGDRFAVEGNVTDIITTSPFEREDFPDVPGIDIKRPQNGHATLGVRWRF